MNVQIFGKSKCFDTKKAERYFKERKIPFQRIELPEKGMSRGEFHNILQAIGSIEALTDEKSEEAILLRYLASNEAKEEKLLENPKLFKTPIVRNGKKATVGYSPDVWSTWA